MKKTISHLLIITQAILLFASCSPVSKSQLVKTFKMSADQPGQSLISDYNPIRSDYKPNEITELCDKAILTASQKFDSIAKIAEKDRTINNTLLALEETSADFSDATLPLTFMGYVSMDEILSAEGSSCEEKVGEFYVTTNTRKDLYLAIKDQIPTNSDEARLLSETLKTFESNGLKLTDEKLTKLKKLKTELTSLETQFSSNLNSDNTSIELTLNELDGAPSDYINSLKKSGDGSKYIVTTRSSDYGLFLNNANNSGARKKWLTAYYNRQGIANTLLLEKAITLRQEIAALMEFKTWADYRINGRMAADAATVSQFLDGLKNKLSARNASDIQALLKYKKEFDPTATKVEAWDINYLSNQVKKRDFSVDEEKISEYFPSEVVIAGLFDVYSQLLGVTYKEVPNAKVWSPDVKMYQIENKNDELILGYFYTDFVPRAGKYGHAAAFPLISGRVKNNQYTYPVASIVANLNPPFGDKPSLLSHDDVETLFHEFGHIMHQTLTRAPYASLSGSSVSQDFVEAPSQMLENWVWDTKILSMISGHYLDHSKKLPTEMLNKMLAARDFNQGYYYTRQLMLAQLDMKLHTTTGPVNVTATYDQLYKEMIGVDPIENGHFTASFGHLMGGYDAGYYGYLWSEVYATDMFTRFSNEGLLNSKTGADYRNIILQSGNMLNALDLLKQFLGRNPNSEAFFKKLHI